MDAARARGEVLGPLAGLPMTVKEAYDMVGTPTTVGLVSRASHRATSDAFHVARLRAAGAVFVGKTNVPQLMLSNDSQNPLYGPTKNPWNLNRSAGGSSGGEASAIAAGFAPLGLGSDIGGSLRLPANACGICSLKPTSGRLTMAGHFDPLPGQEAILAQPGPMARHVSDLDMAFRFLATPEQCTVDPAVPPLPASDPAAVRGPLRVAFYIDNGVFPVAPAIARAVREAADALRERGLTAEEWQPPELTEAWELWLALLMADGSPKIRELCRGNPVDPSLGRLLHHGRISHRMMNRVIGPLMDRLGQHLVGQGVRCLGHRSAAEFLRLVHRRTKCRSKFLAAMSRGKFDAILCPVDAIPAMRPGRGGDLTHASAIRPCTTCSACRRAPSPSRACGPGKKARPASRDVVVRAARETERKSAGLPVGVQIVAHHWREDIVLSVMQMIEDHFANRPDYPTRPPI